jgi:CIC family chloride channel protein
MMTSANKNTGSQHASKTSQASSPESEPAAFPRRLWQLILARVQPNLAVFVGEKQPLVWLLALAVGVGAAYLAIAFRILIGIIQLPWLGTSSESVYEAASALPWWVVLSVPALGGLIVGLLLTFLMPGKRARGVPDVIEARALLGCRIPAQEGLGNALVSAVSLGMGASAGREGPVVHLGATLASVLKDLFALPHSAQRTLLACGVAAAVSASFNAPIAGVLFAHEVILGHYALRAFVPIVISSVAATVVARLHLGDFPAFVIPAYQITTYWEFPAFALLGLVCAGVAIAFQLAVAGSDRAAKSIDIPLWLRPVIGGLMVGAIAIWFPQVLGVGYDATDAALNHQFQISLLLALLVAKTAATAITLASRFGGGVFSPSLYLGAMAGGAYGLMAAEVFPVMISSEGLYALIGMGAVTAAVLGAPISTVLIVFELTGGYEMTIALLLAVSISSGLSQATLGQSFFHWQLAMRGLFLQEGPHKSIVQSLRVRDFMSALEADETPEPPELEGDVAWLAAGDTIETALQAYDAAGETRIVVVEGTHDMTPIGWAEQISALNALNRALIEAHEEHHL